jgi:hypothetical protein
MPELEADLHFLALPLPAATALRTLEASPRLFAHHVLVHQVAVTMLIALAEAWPTLSIDREAVLLGAATHDIGKTTYPEELTGLGRKHETVGPDLLIAQGFARKHARFARTHGQWAHQTAPTIEDLLVALANTIWKGKRNQRLEDAVTTYISHDQGQEVWEVFMTLDDILVGIAEDAEIRLAWLEARDPE